MSTTLITLSAEALVAVLLVVTIIYCAVLNRRLKRLRADESDLRAVITELVTATEIAERAIGGLKEAAVECDRSLVERMREAEHFSMELSEEITDGRKLLQRIKQIAIAAKKPDDRPAAVAPAAPPLTAPAAPAEAAVSVKPEDRISSIEFEKAVTASLEVASAQGIEEATVSAIRAEVQAILPPPPPKGNRIEELRAMAEQARERLKELRKLNTEKAA
jgi:hypothetical protein